MTQFVIQFKNCPALHCQLDNTVLAKQYYTLLRNQCQLDPQPIFRDQQRYTLEYFQGLARQAKQILGWDWIHEQYTLAITTQLHKDLESYLANGFTNIPEQHDQLIHELHYALHAIENGSQRNNWLQLEWFDDNGFEILPDQYPAKINLDFGDIRLQNPYVGHHPLYIYEQQDTINISQTCRFHDFAKPGINIVINKSPITINSQFNWNAYFNWFCTYGADFVQQHGINKLKKFTGHPVIGRIVNLSDLEQVLHTPVLEFEQFVF